MPPTQKNKLHADEEEHGKQQEAGTRHFHRLLTEKVKKIKDSFIRYPPHWWYPGICIINIVMMLMVGGISISDSVAHVAAMFISFLWGGKMKSWVFVAFHL